MSKRVTIVDVARACGLAPSTVSNALSNKSYVTEKTRQLVLETAERLGYRASMTARSLRTQRTYTIGMLASDITNSFYAEILSGIEAVAWNRGYSLIIGNTEFSSAKQSRYIASMLDKDVDGLLLASHSLSPEDVAALERQNVPVVFLNRYDTRVAADYVGVDNQLGMQLAMSHLIDRGHRRIGYIGGRGVATAAQERLAGFRFAMMQAGLPVDETLVTAGDYSEESGRQAAAQVLSGPDKPTAIMCANDLMALGAMAYAVQNGLDVPGDVSLVGFDDIDFAGHPRLSLTTVHYPRADSGRVAADMLFDRIEHKGQQPFQNVRLRPHLMVRNSVRAIPVASDNPVTA